MKNRLGRLSRLTTSSFARLQSIPFVLGILVLAGIWFGSGESGRERPGFRLDDAWIHMVYGRELAETGLLAYNSGDPATGSTSPLWAVLLGIVHLVLGHCSIGIIIAAVYALGILFFLSSVILSSLLSFRLSGQQWTGIAAGVILALSPSMASAAFSGMEVLLCTALLLGALLALTSGRLLASGSLMALATLARPESAIVSVLACVYILVERNQRLVGLLKFILPSAALGALWFGYDYLVSGFPLPATFYVKRQFVPAEFPSRLFVAVKDIIGGIPPFLGYAGWLGAIGLVLPRAQKRLKALLPFLAGLLFFIANASISPPIDPDAFYHVRYLMPAVPLLIVGIAVGSGHISLKMPRWKYLPQVFLIACGIVGCIMTIQRESVHLHNDIRNINEVQRAMGEWISDHVPPDTWIAATDAGAVRYFSHRNTIDLIGLNTPQAWRGEKWIRERPVSVIALMPSWLQPVNHNLYALRVFDTERYTVTSFPQMSKQLVAVCKSDAGEEPILIELAGVKHTAVYCIPYRGGNGH